MSFWHQFSPWYVIKMNFCKVEGCSLMNDADMTVALRDFTRVVSPVPDSGDAAAGEADASVASQHLSEHSIKSEPDDPDLDTEMDSEGPSEKEEDEGSEEEEEEGVVEEGWRGSGGKVQVRHRRRVREQQQEDGEEEEEEEEIPSK